MAGAKGELEVSRRTGGARRKGGRRKKELTGDESTPKVEEGASYQRAMHSSTNDERQRPLEGEGEHAVNLREEETAPRSAKGGKDELCRRTTLMIWKMGASTMVMMKNLALGGGL